MAQRRSRTPPRKPFSNPTPRCRVARRKYHLRHSPKRAPLKESNDSHATLVATSPASRPVLVPLHTNLRRLPSRRMAPLRGRDISTNMSSNVKTGSKRKRVASANENTCLPVRGTRSTGRFKRQRSQNDSSDDEFGTTQITMEVDENLQNWSSDLSETEEPLLDASDDYLIHEAEARQLNRLRKDELVRLYSLAGLTMMTEDLTKSNIINAIISARIDEEEVPPSSPPGKTDGGYSSDDGHYGGDEETDATRGSLKSLRRRVTLQDIRTGDAPNKPGNSNKKLARIAKDVKNPVHGHSSGTAKRRGLSIQCSVLTSVSNSLPSPPATRLRSRTISAEINGLSALNLYTSSTSAGTSRNNGPSISGHSKRSGKVKHVDFGDTGDHGPNEGLDGSQDDEDAVHSPSPRRLRSKGRGSVSSNDDRLDVDELKKRVTPMRKAKGKIGCLKEDSTATDTDESHGNASDDEVDQLDSSPSPAGSSEPRQDRQREQRTPLWKRLRSRKLQTHTPPSDGDDEQEEDDEVALTVQREDEEADEDGEEVASVEDDDEDEEELTTVGPRKLRSGKIVGEDAVEVDEAEEDLNDDANENSASEIEVDQEESNDIEEGEQMEEEDGVMEDEFDWSSATQKTLIRLRRDDLVGLCESRELDADGTKPQLVQALLRWRDAQDSMTPAPSSSSTARPPSATKANGQHRRTRSQSKSSSSTPPVLMRSNRIHDDEPVTPPLSKERKEGDGDLELDLESLGLEDREIPPDRLTKLDKIGSGGFKDVFTGKFKGRKVAIAEFRDQLSAMDIKELKLLAEFAHPNIVRFLGVSIPENTRETPVMIVSELCSNGDLFDYVRNVPAPSLYKVLSMMLDIARGVQYLHERKPSVIHRDCKSSNILITSKGTAKIADFGLAKVKQSTRSMVRSLVGTVNWQAPELWAAHPKYNHKVDVFSCACVYWEMLQWQNPNKKFPWEGMNEHAIYEAVGQKRQRPSVAGLRKQWCPDIVDLIERMWAQEHQDRPAIAEVVEELQRIIKEYR
ncbi:hypothetical protein EW145_g1443 [Phellinidium pouzarii]|uniref:Protein kinase domain-containing protein n=1 Tax=Phellinidium pouzarii TaxID=167371 RepID=A0A4S4LF51_9AGAM|nr:hypothetical protein EW145_g1443 [Phellinidium pouzarii]